STAQSLQRAKEIGIRKVLGSRRTALVIQFMSETFLLVFIALVLSLALLQPALFAFPSFIPAGLRVNLLDPATLGFALGTLILTTLLSGFYPAWVLSSFVPARTLKNQKSSTGGLGNRIGKGLVVFQFTISIVFIIATIVISNQLHFMLGKDLGFARNAIIHFSGEDKDSLTRRSLLRDRIRALPGVERVSMDWQPPAIHGAWSTTIDHAGPASVKADINVRTADTSYIPLYKLKLLAGRNFLPSDTVKEVVINATYAQMMGFRNPDQAIEQTINLWGKTTPIVGVVADFNLRSLQHAIKPLLITTFANTQTGYSVKLRTRGETMVNFRQTIREIEQNWAAVFPDKPFSYTFVDEALKKLYEGEQKTSRLINLAMAITIIISCMGLFGLAALTAEQRTREIGIRKVLGARAGDITTMLSRDFLLLVVIAFVISSPIAYYFLNRWLQDYTYRTSVSWWIFALAGLSAVSIALLTVIFHAVRAALMNPVKSLRAE
ncbi:MAG: FtsX-like permease family protein, partial [Bacteroidota bacterium]